MDPNTDKFQKSLEDAWAWIRNRLSDTATLKPLSMEDAIKMADSTRLVDAVLAQMAANMGAARAK